MTPSSGTSDRWAHRAAIGLAALSIALGLAGPARAGNAHDEAKAHFSAGADRFDQGDNEGALKEFEAAYALVPSPKIQFNIGMAHERLAHNVEALEAFDAVLAAPASEIPQERRDQASNHRRDLLAKVATITIACERAGITVSIDGVVRGKTPFSHAIYVEPGAHQLLAEGAAQPLPPQSLVATPGAEMTIPISFAATTPPATQVPTTTTTSSNQSAAVPPPPAALLIDARSTPSSATWRGPVKWASLGLGAISLGIGVLETLTAIQKSKDFNNVPDNCMDDGNGHIRGGTRCEQIAHDQTVATWGAAISYGVAGALVATGLILHFREPARERASVTQRSFACVLNPSITGATCAARW